MAVSTMLFTEDRMRATDMTIPYLDVGLKVMLTQGAEQVDIFAAFEPFERELWYSIIGTVWIAGLLISITAFCSPYGYKGRFIQRPDKTDYELSESSNLLNHVASVWSAASALAMQVGQ